MADPSKHVYIADAVGNPAHASRVYLQNVAQVSGAFDAALTTAASITSGQMTAALTLAAPITSGQMTAIAPMTSGQMNAIYNPAVPGPTAPLTSGQMTTILYRDLPRSAFADILVAQPTTQVYALFTYGLEPRQVVTSGIGTWTATPVSGMARLTTGTGLTDRSVLRTRLPLRYIPSQGMDFKGTAVFQSGGQGNQTQFIGVINDYDGYAFGCSGSTFGLFHRNFGVQSFIRQTDWNLNTCPWLDWTKGNVYQVQAQWLGFGRVRYSVEDPELGVLTPVHDQRFTNSRTIPTLSNPSIKLRAEINNNGTSGNPLSMYVCCLDGRTEGGEGLVVPMATSGTAQTSGALVHLGTLRNKANYYGVENQRLVKLDTIMAAINGNNDAFVDVYLNLGVTATAFSDIDTGSSTCDWSNVGVIPASLSGQIEGVFILRNTHDDHDLQRAVYVPPGDTLTFVARRVAGTNVPIYLNVHWSELR